MQNCFGIFSIEKRLRNNSLKPEFNPIFLQIRSVKRSRHIQTQLYNRTVNALLGRNRCFFPKNHTKLRNALCLQKIELFNVKSLVYELNISLYRATQYCDFGH